MIIFSSFVFKCIHINMRRLWVISQGPHGRSLAQTRQKHALPVTTNFPARSQSINEAIGLPVKGAKLIEIDFEAGGAFAAMGLNDHPGIPHCPDALQPCRP